MNHIFFRMAVLGSVLATGLVAPPEAQGQQQGPLTTQDSAAIRRALQERQGGMLRSGQQSQRPQAAAGSSYDWRDLASPLPQQPVTHAQIIESLRQSGLTRAEVRMRLQREGHDPSLVDQHFNVIEQGTEPPRGIAPPELVEALRAIGVVIGSPDMLPDSLAADSLAADSLRERELEVFGRSLFRQPTYQFEPLLLGPVDADYRIGPGDELVLVLTGDVELSYTLPVSRDGLIVIPDVGQLPVNGLTLRELENRLYARLGRVYSGVRRGPSATTHFQVSLGRLRTNQVYVIGDIERPGAYQVSSVSTVLNALYRAGGPTERGSFRRIAVRRGGEPVQTVDLYDYLLRGDSRADIRLEHGDIVFVPTVGPQLRLEGAVRRPAIYELKPGEDLRDALNFAGGFEAEALVRRVQIDRILPPDRRRPGIDRVLVDVNIDELLDPEGADIEVRDGDAVQVFAVSEERRHRVVVTGEVRRPGLYEWADGLTLWSLIDRAEGLAEPAYTPRAHIFRLNPLDGNRRLIRTPLLADSIGRPLRDVLLADRDSVVVYSRETLLNPRTVIIDGFVKNPGAYTLAEGMTVPDLILAAGGFITGAYTGAAEVARQPDPSVRTEVTAEIFYVSLTDGAEAEAGDNGVTEEKAATFTHAGADNGSAELPVWVPEPDEFELRHGDRIFVRRMPGYEMPRTVTITGQVSTPGTYVLETRQERLSSIIQRAGGLTSEAYAAGFQLFREGKLVATDLTGAVRDPDSRHNVIVQENDSLHVPEYDPTILVTGAVAFESRVLYEPGKGLDHYIRRAGGYAEHADRKRVSITHMDGEREASDRVLLVFTNDPDPAPGSTIFVPLKPESERGGFGWRDLLNATSSVAAALLPVLLVLDRMNASK